MIIANLMLAGLSIFSVGSPVGCRVPSRAGGCLAAPLEKSSWSILLAALITSPYRCETSSSASLHPGHTPVPAALWQQSPWLQVLRGISRCREAGIGAGLHWENLI